MDENYVLLLLYSKKTSNLKKINDQKGAIIIAEKKTYIFMQSTTTRKL